MHAAVREWWDSDWARRPAARDSVPRFVDDNIVRFLGTTDRRVWVTSYRGCRSDLQWTAPISAGPGGETATASVAASTRAGVRIFIGTSEGGLRVHDANGAAIARVNLAGGPVRFLSAIATRDATFVAASCADRTIRIVDEVGETRAAFETPGTPLGTDLTVGDNGLEILGGVGQEATVYIWNLNRILTSRGASPRLVLRGGKEPAFGSRFFKYANHLYVTHGSWDGGLYLYSVGNALEGLVTPLNVFAGDDPLYGLTVVHHAGMPFVFAGGESGAIHGWGLNPCKWSCCLRLKSRPLRSSVKFLRAARIGPESELVLIAGSRDGATTLFRPDHPTAALDARFDSLPTAVAGVDLFSAR